VAAPDPARTSGVPADLPREIPGGRPRDRDATARSLLAAAVRVLAQDGFTALGPQAVAREAGCDKKLVYRYFGGIDGLIEALGSELALWLGGPPPVMPPGAKYAERAAELLIGYAALLRRDPALLRILAWELAGPSPALLALEQRRAVAIQAWAAEALAGTAPPPGVDAAAVNAILLAAVHYLSIRAESVGQFAGADLASPEAHARLDAALRFLVQRAYANPPP